MGTPSARLAPVAVLVGVALVAAACGANVNPGASVSPGAASGSQGVAPGSPAGSPAANGESLIIGASLTLTGIQAPFDEPGLRGANLAVEELNKAGGVLGRQVELVNLDGKSDPVTVGNNAIQLIEQGAAAVIAPCDFDFGSPASREAQKAGLVGISTCASSPLYNSENLGDKQFTLSMWNTTMGSAAAEYAYKEKGWRTAYIVTDTFIDYTKSLSVYFKDSFENAGGEVLGEDTYTQGAQDFSAQLQRIQALPQQPDVYFVSSYQPDLGTIIRAMRSAGITAPIFGGDSYDDPQLVQTLGDLGRDVFFITHTYATPDAGPDMAAFLDLWETKHGEPPDTAFVATGWDTVNVLAQAIEEAGSTDGAGVAKAMEDLTFELLTGKLDWSDAASGHEPNKETVVVEIAQGETKFLGWYLPEYLPER
jgi:branched-chain amino acid transport system substrate-binding protein